MTVVGQPYAALGIKSMIASERAEEGSDHVDDC
jgi:hypothetical protein